MVPIVAACGRETRCSKTSARSLKATSMTYNIVRRSLRGGFFHSPLWTGNPAWAMNKDGLPSKTPVAVTTLS